MGTVHSLAAQSGGVRLGDAVATFLDTISVPNTRRGYGAALHRLVVDFGTDTTVASLEPDRVAGWFTSVWGDRSAKTFNTRLTALGSACEAGCLEQVAGVAHSTGISVSFCRVT